MMVAGPLAQQVSDDREVRQQEDESTRMKAPIEMVDLEWYQGRRGRDNQPAGPTKLAVQSPRFEQYEQTVDRKRDGSNMESARR